MQNNYLLFVSLVIVFNLLNFQPIIINCWPLNDQPLDAIELTAKLLIDLDEKIDKCLETEITAVKTVNKFSQLYIPPNENEIANQREEKFSEVLRDLAKMETQIQEAIKQAQANRRYQLVARLRPLLNYVGHIRRNMDLLRNRMVAVTTLSSLAFTVNEIVDQFADVMTSSFGFPGGVVALGDRVAVSAIKERVSSTTSIPLSLSSSSPSPLKVDTSLKADTNGTVVSQ
ncbi:uncharacterized protein LOC128958402 [Oppia nitens]|uniref:uncharacterized protein LOC128958402 n=1 Tax=Oppia nitens TaxID=1686743 RepID=UPI0023DB2C75|nr:uncharacterized protein LOC128958402 [Oppia nitens]